MGWRNLKPKSATTRVECKQSDADGHKVAQLLKIKLKTPFRFDITHYVHYVSLMQRNVCFAANAFAIEAKIHSS
jgi:hypothetical protein